MGTFSVENQGTYSFLVYELNPEDTIDSLCLGMITHNSIPGISQAVFTQMDEKKFVKYNITSRIPVDQFLSGMVTRKRLLGVFSSLAAAFLSAEDYMIDISTLLLDTQYMYADVRTNSAVLICLPIAQTDKEPVDLQKFFKNIMFSTQFDQTENCDYIGRILNYINGSAQFSIIDFKKMLEKLLEMNTASAQTHSQAPVQQAAPASAQNSAPSMPPAAAPAPAASSPQVIRAQQTQIPPMQKPAAVPPRAPIPAQQPVRAAAGPKEPEISLFYLLQHYNKDNAATYKQQKEQKKAEKAGGNPAAPAQPPKIQQPPRGKQPAPAAYAVPGLSNPAAPVPNMQQQKPQQNIAPSAAGRTPEAGAPAAQPIFIPKQEMQQKPASFGETTVLGAGSNEGETTLLSEASPSESVAWLIRVKNNERIPIRKEDFKIGKSTGYVDYVVADNAAVSRNHADVLFKDGKYFLQDNNSTNHTYVNGKLIPGNTPVQLMDGDSVSLANELFRFER